MIGQGRVDGRVRSQALAPGRADRLGSGTPPTDRGVLPTTGSADASGTPLTVGCHWLTGTDAGTVWDWLDLLTALTDGGEVEVRSGRNFYRTHYVVGGVVSLMADPMDASTMPAVCVDVPGSGCDWLGRDRLSAIVGALDKLTRVDLALDHVPCTPAQMADADERLDIRTRSLSSSFYEALRGEGGSTYKLGSKASDRELVAYDRRGHTRVELRSRRERAEGCRALLLGPSEEMVAATLGLVRGMVDFVDAGSDANESRRRLLPWWAAVVEASARVVQQVVPRVAATVERKIAWLRGTVSRTLAAVAAGGLDVDELLRHGRIGASGRHRALTHQMLVLLPGGG